MNIWECAKVYLTFIGITCIIVIIAFILIIARFIVISCTRWWVEGASTTGLMHLITGKSSRVTQAGWEVTPSFAVLPDKVVRFLIEFHSFRFLGLGLPPLPADRSYFDMHGAIKNDEVLWILLYHSKNIQLNYITIVLLLL